MTRDDIKIKKSLFLCISIIISLLAILVIPRTSYAAVASDNRPPYNTPETAARNLCIADGWPVARYGAIWLTNSASYYANSVDIPKDATSVTVQIRGSVYGCHHGGIDNIYATNVSPDPAYSGSFRLSGFPASPNNYFFRGTSQGAHNWSTQGGQLTVTFDTTGLATNNINRTDSQNIDVGLYRCFDLDTSNPPTGSCYTEVVTITVNRAPQHRVQAHVFMVDTNGTFLGDIQGAQLTTCYPLGGSQITTDSVGFAYMNIDESSGFCMRVASVPAGSLPSGYTGPFVRPWSNGYHDSNNPDPSCPNNNPNPPPGFVGPPYTGKCNIGTYEWQRAGISNGYQTVAPGLVIYDRNTNTGYDFVYVVSPVSCGSINAVSITDSTKVISPSPSELFDIRATFTNASGAPALANSTSPLVITVPASITVGGNYTTTYSPDPVNGGGTGTAVNNRSGLHFSAATAGSYTLNYTIAGKSCSGTISIATNPYMRVYGGDVVAGSSFMTNGTCPASNSSAGILAFTKSGTPGAGAGTQLMAMAMNTIYQYSSAVTRTTWPSPSEGLTLANTGVTLDANRYGGSYGYAPCIPDYYGSISNIDTSIWTKVSIASGGDYATGNITIPNSTRRVVYSSGSLNIKGNITYPGATAAAGWSNASEIPSIYVIANGNIYISGSVTQLDGVYIAQGGTIYTCAGTNVAYTASQVASSCSSKLTVNGVLVANNVKFLRTPGTVNAAAATNTEAASSANIAEVIQYTPEIFLVGSPFPRAGFYESVIGLPPIF